MEQAPSRGHEASPQSGLGVGWKRWLRADSPSGGISILFIELVRARVHGSPIIRGLLGELAGGGAQVA